MGAEQLVAMESRCDELRKAADDAEMVKLWSVWVFIIVMHLFRNVMYSTVRLEIVRDSKEFPTFLVGNV